MLAHRTTFQTKGTGLLNRQRVNYWSIIAQTGVFFNTPAVLSYNKYFITLTEIFVNYHKRISE